MSKNDDEQVQAMRAAFRAMSETGSEIERFLESRLANPETIIDSKACEAPAQKALGKREGLPQVFW